MADGRLRATGDAVMERVTPTAARRMLEWDLHGSSVDRARVEMFRLLMVAGEWRQGDCEEPIILDCAGRLENGRHRLRALELADVTLLLPVRRG